MVCLPKVIASSVNRQRPDVEEVMIQQIVATTMISTRGRATNKMSQFFEVGSRSLTVTVL
jgi:hypothetical protein